MRKLRHRAVREIHAVWHWWGPKNPLNFMGLLPFCVCQINPDKTIIVKGSYSTSNQAFRRKQTIEWMARKDVHNIGGNHQFKVMFLAHEIGAIMRYTQVQEH